MSAPYSTLTKDDYLQAAQALLPRGPAWPRDGRATLTKYMDALARVLWLAHKAVTHLFETELDPKTTDDMLSDWEKAFGITGRGSGDERRDRLAMIIADGGGCTAAHYVAVAAAVGVNIPSPVRTGSFTWEVYPPVLSPEDRTALEAAIRLHNRASCIVSFVDL